MQTELSLDPRLPPAARDGIQGELLRTVPVLGWHAACEAIAATLQAGGADEHPWQVYALAALLAPEREGVSLRAEALFMLGRIDMRRVTLAAEKRRASERASQAAKAQRKGPSDELLHKLVTEWERRNGNRSHGRRAWIHAQLTDEEFITERTLTLRLRKIGK